MNKPKLAVLTSRFPYPIDKGDKLRLYYQLRDLSTWFDIYLFALHETPISEDHLKKLQPYCKHIVTYHLPKTHWPFQTLRCFQKELPLQLGYFLNHGVRKTMQHAIQQLNPDVLYVQLSRMMPYAEGLPYPKVLDLQDCFSLNYTRAADRHQGPKAWFYQRESRTMAQYEKHILNHTEATTIISRFDKDALPIQPNSTEVIPNGVDSSYFHPIAKARTSDLVFVGNLSYQPNQDAVAYLVNEIMPLLHKQQPGIRLLIAGAHMPTFMKKWESDTVQCAGWFNDIRDAYASASLFVAPLFSGAGLQNKLLEAMSMGMPCVTTSVVNASLNADPNRNIIIANNADEISRAILQLLTNKDEQTRIGLAARQHIETHFVWESANEKLKQLLQQQIGL